MELEKSITAVAALIGALTGLVTALIGLVKALRNPSNQPSPANTTEPQFPTRGQRADPEPGDLRTGSSGEPIPDRGILRRSYGRRVLVIGCVLLGVSLAVAGWLYFRTSSFDIQITKPVPGSLNVRVVDNGTSAEYEVQGSYTGPISKTGQGIYVLVRPGNKAKEPWYLQDPPEILREDSWYRRGEWRLENAYVGRGPDEAKLQTGEDWEIKAVIAPESPGSRQLNGIPPGEVAQKLSVIAESETVKVKIVVNP